MRRWLFALLAACLPAATQAEAGSHPGIYLGVGEVDQSGDSRYLTLDWCGEDLWIVTDQGPLLIDPENGGAVPHHAPAAVVRHPGLAGLIACSKARGQTILWFDPGEDEIIWQSLDGTQSGEIRGFVRAMHTWDLPLIDMTDTMLVGIAAEGRTLEASGLPDGIKLVSIARNALDGILGPDRLTDFSVLSDGLLVLGAFHESDDPSDPAHRRDFDTFVVNADLDGDIPKLGESVLVEDTVPDDTLVGPVSLDAEGSVIFSVGRDLRKDCRLVAVAKGPVLANCIASPPEDKALATQEHPERFDQMESPSGRWFAWDEWADDGRDSKVHFYLAPTVDLLKP
jgi:hypothetical protein